MARKVTVPIDMSSEQKVILGIISKRQLIYLIVGGIILYVYIPIVFKLFSDPLTGVIFSLFAAAPTIGVVGLLGFMRHQKHNLNFDRYYILKMKYNRQLGVWRKGPAIIVPKEKPIPKKKERK